MADANSTTVRIQSFFRKIWNWINPRPKNLKGSQRPYVFYNNNDETLWGRNYDFEIREVVLRNPEKGVPLVEMFEKCPEVSTPIFQITNAMNSSQDGDDRGFGIADTLNDNKTRVDPQVKYYLDRLIDEKIGGSELSWAQTRFLVYGDAFASVQINLRLKRIVRLLPLPTWQTFRVESDSGELLRFEQRYHLSEITEKSSLGTSFQPGQVVHWRFLRNSIYGRSLFYQLIDDWECLKVALRTLRSALIEVGINPNLHIFPCEVSNEFVANYKETLEAKRMANGGKPVADYFMFNGGEVRKVSTKDPDLSAILETLKFYRRRFIMASNTPPWMLAEEMNGGREISQGPALAYARFINGCRQSFSQGIRHLCNLELALNGFSPEQWKYRIIWPKIYVNPYEQQANPQADETNHQSIDDLDQQS